MSVSFTNTLIFTGEKAEVDRFLKDIKNENSDIYRFFGDVYPHDKVRYGKAYYYFYYDTHRGVYISRLLEFLSDYPSLDFILEYESVFECLQGKVIIKGGKMIKQYEGLFYYDRSRSENKQLLKLVGP